MYKHVFTIDKDNIVIGLKSVGANCQLMPNDFEISENKAEILGCVFNEANKNFTDVNSGVVVYAY